MSKHRIHWNDKQRSMVAAAFAATQVRLSGGGKKPSFRQCFEEAQTVLPKKLWRKHVASFAQCNGGFKEAVEAELAKITQPKTTNGHAKNGVATMEIMVAPNGVSGFRIPYGLNISPGLRTTLTDLGFKFHKAKSVEEIDKVLGGISGIQNFGYLP
jgi:hypothetical protein